MGTRERTRAGRTLWLLPPLLFLFTPGCFSIYGPRSARGPRGGSATIECRYDSGWETYYKWWCRGEAWGSCEILVKTTGSEHKVQRGRVAIQDNHWRNAFTVTIEALRDSDQDVYWCGIEKSFTDLGHQVHVFVDPDMAEFTSTDTAEPTSTYPDVLETTPALASLASSPLTNQSSNGSSVALTRSLTRFLLCNLYGVLLTFTKALLLVSLLCTGMWLRRQQGNSGGEVTSASAGELQLPGHRHPRTD